MLASELLAGDTLDGVGKIFVVQQRNQWTRVSVLALHDTITFDLPAEMPVLATRPEKPSEVRPRRQQPSESKRKSPIPTPTTRSGLNSGPSSAIGGRTDLLPTLDPEQ